MYKHLHLHCRQTTVEPPYMITYIWAKICGCGYTFSTDSDASVWNYVTWN